MLAERFVMCRSWRMWYAGSGQQEEFAASWVNAARLRAGFGPEGSALRSLAASA